MLYNSTPRGQRALRKDEDGNVGIIFALMAIPMFGIMGAAVDYGRYELIRQDMQGAADAAAMAGVGLTSGSDSQRIALATTVYKQNISGSTPGTIGEPTITYSQGTMSVNATASMETTMLGVMGVDSLDVAVSSEGESLTSGNKAEVAMMIDLTGSMGSTRNGMTKIAALKLAGEDILGILFPNGETTSSNVKVAVAPFADYVNAGEYAPAVTGLPSTGSYNNQYNLASTKHGPFSGSYTGSYTGSSTGSQAGATSAASTQAGATFDNTYCASPTYVTTNTQIVYRTGQVSHHNYTWPVAAAYNTRNFTGASWGYFWVENYMGYPGNWAYGRMYYRAKTSVTSTTNVYPGCESGNANTGPLVTCVTERTDTSHRYDDEVPSSGGYVGAYNQSATGTTNKLNYSSDGKCHTAGRELAKVVPLTNTKGPLTAFFNGPNGSGPLIGGGTPGHLGTAWAWYLLSPNWSSIWPSESQPAAYNDAGTKKYAIIMTDGEYNMQYSSVSSRTQAAELCTAMKAKGIKVFTVGFGFSTSSVAGSNTAEGKAKEVLQSCASDSSSYYFPYDGDALRQVFQSIGNSITGSSQTAATPTLTQ